VVPLPGAWSAAAPAALGADVVLVDLADWFPARLAARRGRRIAETPGPAFIALAEAPDEALVAAALRAGAQGVLPYGAGVAELAAAVEAAATGLVVLPSELGSAVTSRSRRRQDGRRREPPAALTERERDVLALLAAGLPNRAIGSRLGISEQTVKTYVAAILDKLGAATRAEAVAIGARRGLIML
jgi:DNA-binding NarL/FixJ family response regulator